MKWCKDELLLKGGGRGLDLIGLVFFVVDLVPRGNAVRWIECLQKEFPVVAFKASTQIKDRTVVGAF